MAMSQMKASQFKAQCLSVLDHLDPEGIVITKRGKPVARVVPFASSCAHLIGSMRGKFEVRGDLMTTGLKWDAES
jgi:prevent-host-death family protein